MLITIGRRAAYTVLPIAVLFLAACATAGSGSTERVELSPMLSQNESWTYTFSEEGIYNIRCQPHPQMIQIVRVVPAPGAQETHEATMRGSQFQPREIIVKPGDDVTWINEDNVQHDVDVRLVVEEE